MNPHPLAALFPLMTGPAFEDLRTDIARQGLIEPIVIHEGMVLDGRNRLRACIETGTPPVFREWNGSGTALDYVISMNLVRRHLDPTQLAMVAARHATMNRGRPAINTEISAFSQGRASELFNVSPDSIQFARKVLDRGTPELITACDQGAVKVSQAAQLADTDPAYQLAVLGKIQAGLPVMEARRQLKRETLKTAEWPEGKYPVLYADPAWQYNDARSLAGYEGTAAENNYSTMSVPELCALPVKDLAHDDAVLFCWATFPLVPDALTVIAAWGFTYKTAFVWNKGAGAFSNYHNASAELLMVATRGSCLPDPSERECQVQTWPRTRHSEKPEAFRKLVDSLYPHCPRIELFARQRYEGWDVWGNEVDGDVQ